LGCGGEGRQETVKGVDARVIIGDVGRRVRSYRERAGLSQPDLGMRSGVTGKFIGQIERGESNPSLKSLIHVAAALGCELGDLIQPGAGVGGIVLDPDDARRTREAVAVLVAMLKTTRQRQRPRRWTTSRSR
jgi:transcriptional regulator with XRE-family HTH domain